MNNRTKAGMKLSSALNGHVSPVAIGGPEGAAEEIVDLIIEAVKEEIDVSTEAEGLKTDLLGRLTKLRDGYEHQSDLPDPDDRLEVVAVHLNEDRELTLTVRNSDGEGDLHSLPVSMLRVPYTNI